MKKILNSGNGECLFLSIGYFFNKSGNEVRQEINNKIRSDCSNIIFAGKKLCCVIREAENLSVRDYCTRMSISTTCGGEIELYVASILYNVSIEVYETVKEKFVLKYRYPAPQSSEKVIRLHYSRNHYEALV